jgi:hypothetical protein
MKKEKKPKQKPDRLSSLANIFLKDFKVGNPHRSGIEYDVYLKTVVSGIEKKHLNHLLKDLARKQDLGKKKIEGYVRNKIKPIIAPHLKDTLFQKFKKGREEMKKKIAEGEESSQYIDLDGIEREKLQKQFPGKSDEELREIYWSNEEDEKYLIRKVEDNIQWLKEHLIGEISSFAMNIIPALNLDFDLNFPFHKRLVVAAIKSKCETKEVVDVIDAYFESRKYYNKDIDSAFSDMKTEAINKGFWDLVEEDKRSYQKFIEEVKEKEKE